MTDLAQGIRKLGRRLVAVSKFISGIALAGYWAISPILHRRVPNLSGLESSLNSSILTARLGCFMPPDFSATAKVGKDHTLSKAGVVCACILCVPASLACSSIAGPGRGACSAPKLPGSFLAHHRTTTAAFRYPSWQCYVYSVFFESRDLPSSAADPPSWTSSRFE